MCRSGLNFERSAILTWLQDHGNTNPLTRDTLRPSGLVPNRALEAKISSWCQVNNIRREQSNGPEGAQINDLFTCPASELERTPTKERIMSHHTPRSGDSRPSRPAQNSAQARVGLSMLFRRL
jgi:U-box domain